MTSPAHAVLERFRQAAVDRSTEDMGALYAEDAVHEFPFTAPGLPSRLEGRDAIMSWSVAVWDTDAFTYTGYRTLAVHHTDDPETIIVEQEAIGTSAATGEFVLPNVVVLTVRDGRIVRLRDYVDILAAMAVAGAR